MWRTLCALLPRFPLATGRRGLSHAALVKIRRPLPVTNRPQPPPTAGVAAPPRPSRALPLTPFRHGRDKSRISPLELLPPSSRLQPIVQYMNWDPMNLLPATLTVLKQMQLLRPSEIQQRAFGLLRRGDSAVCAAGSGTGKTLAYLIPLIEALVREGARQPGEAPLRVVAAQPRMVILTPSQLLTVQVAAVARQLAEAHGLSVCTASGLYSKSTLRRLLNSKPHDIVVATPDSLWWLLNTGSIELKDVRRVVIEEADSLLENRTRAKMEALLRRMHKGPSQHVFVTSALTSSVMDFVDGNERWLGAVSQVTASNLHRIPRRVRLAFVLCKRNRTNCLDQFLALISRDGHRPGPAAPFPSLAEQAPAAPAAAAAEEEEEGGDMVDEAEAEGLAPNIDLMPSAKQPVTKVRPQLPKPQRTLVFCNKIRSCQKLSHVLTARGIPHACCHGAMDPTVSQANYQAFVKGRVSLMVATDVLGRGLDDLRVTHVVMYDYPLNLLDYLHRMGRTGRMGQRHDFGLCTALVTRYQRREALMLAGASRRQKSVLQAVDDQGKPRHQYLPTVDMRPHMVFSPKMRAKLARAIKYRKTGREHPQFRREKKSARAKARAEAPAPAKAEAGKRGPRPRRRP